MQLVATLPSEPHSSAAVAALARYSLTSAFDRATRANRTSPEPVQLRGSLSTPAIVVALESAFIFALVSTATA